MIIEKVLKETEDKMKKTIEATRREFVTIRTGRATSALVDSVKVEYYDTPTPLKQLATISTPDVRLLVIHPWDKSCLGAIEKAILASDIGLTPTNDGKVIRISIPHLTEERREELTKVVRRIAEDGRVALRSVRRDAVEHLRQKEKEGAITVDQRFKSQDRAQELTDKYIGEIDHIVAEKEKEIKEV